VQGTPTAICGYRNWTLFVAFYNASEDASYLMRWGAWHLLETEQGIQRVFVPGWHGALYKFTGVQILSLFVTNVPATNPRLYIGDDDGVIHYITLPRYSMAWRSDANCTFNTTNAGLVYFPQIHHGVPHEEKVNLAVVSNVENLSGATRYIDVTYRTVPTGTFGGAGNITDAGRFNSDPGQRKNFTAGVSSRMTELLATLTTTTSASPAVLKAIAVYQAVRPVFKWLYTVGLRVGDGVRDHHGQVITRYSGEDDQMDDLEAAAGAAGPVSVTTPRGEVVDVIVTDLSVQARAQHEGQPLEWVALVEAMQHRTVQNYGTYGRMEPYTYGGLEVYSYGGLEIL